MAAAMGIELLTEDQYRFLQTLGEFDLKTSSWILAPPEVRALGGALFCDRRYGKVFTYRNGVQSYYAARRAQLSYALSVGVELAPHNVQVNAIAQNFVANPTYFPAEVQANPHFQERIAREVPLGRLGGALNG